jgi:hypothetical protein
MNKEEKEAIESLRKNRGVSFAQADIISNLIEKQQKENEELKERLSIIKEQQNSILTEKIKILREEKIELIHNFEEKEKISKKEIKSLLEEIEELKQITLLYNSYKVPDERKIVIADSEYFVNEFFKDFIHKDKIREILNQYGKKDIGYAVDFYKEIKELLEE